MHNYLSSRDILTSTLLRIQRKACNLQGDLPRENLSRINEITVY
jgi:hypothetical protein